ncbi:hypothetical protein [Neisseria zalophi]|uniref:Uncharacterized protein n=1 Tax=Neisseria zalophi TaxID=640030 RepID=A0A5J6PVC8_9NEIS|nr:hypothetical protein [Neisseria zalophi]QEY26236.1 hypothetical protein D0T92_06670 [Neisseria zalophi]
MNIYEPIIPAKSLGGIVIGNNISNYSKILKEYNLIGKLKFSQVDIYSCMYEFIDFPIEIYVDIRTGSIYKISALSGYLGKFDSISIGTPIHDVLALNLGFYYDECEEAFFSKNLKGIALEVADDDPPLEEAIKMNIQSITIYNSDLFDDHKVN